MGFNDGSADRQANADSRGLGGVERLENAFTILRGGTAAAHGWRSVALSRFRLLVPRFSPFAA